jgi:hypothetical protein
MEYISIILTVIGLAVLVFSIWSHLLIRRHIRNKWTHEITGTLADEKYFELKSKQEFIIATSTIIFALISFIGFSSISEIKKNLNDQIATERKKVDSLRQVANNSLDNLELRGKDYKDSVLFGLKLLKELRKRYLELSDKDIIRQNIFIVDDLKIGDFKKVDYFFRIVNFKDLKTVSGQRLPDFKTPPSIIVFSSTSSELRVDEVSQNSFKISPFMSTDSKVAKTEEDIRFCVWISQKPSISAFSNDFGKEFK